MKNGQPAPALRRVTTFQIETADTGRISVMYNNTDGVVSIAQEGGSSSACIALRRPALVALSEALDILVQETNDEAEAAPPPRKRTDVAGAILGVIRGRPVPADEDQRVEFLLAHTGLERDQLVASLGRLLKTGKIAVNGDLLVTLPPNG